MSRAMPAAPDSPAREARGAVVALVLAAGFSRRFGSDKLRTLLPDGEPLIAHCLRQLRTAKPQLDIVVVCQGAMAADLERKGYAISRELRPFPAAERGMGASLAFGAQSISRRCSFWMSPTSDGTMGGAAMPSASGGRGERGRRGGFSGRWPKLRGILVCLGDMPYIAAGTYSRLAAAVRPDNIIVPTCQGRLGHPVAFGVNFLPELCRLDGDRGARAVVEARQDALSLMPVADEGILLDIDTAADLHSHPARSGDGQS